MLFCACTIGVSAYYAGQAHQQLLTMQVSEELPTIFASTLGKKVGLLIKRKKKMNHKKFNKLKDKMTYFQQMAVTSNFEDCVAVYFGMELDDDQIAVLRLIHRTTKPWMTGHIVGVCLKRISGSRTQNKDFADSVRVLIEQLTETSDGEISKKVKGILVKSSRTEMKNK